MSPIPLDAPRSRLRIFRLFSYAKHFYTKPLTLYAADMCRRRQIRTVYKRCGHGVTAEDEIVQCYADNCTFSPNHPVTCTGDACKKRCWHYRQAPQQYTEEKDLYCSTCNAAGYY